MSEVPLYVLPSETLGGGAYIAALLAFMPILLVADGLNQGLLWFNSSTKPAGLICFGWQNLASLVFIRVSHEHLGVRRGPAGNQRIKPAGLVWFILINTKPY